MKRFIKQTVLGAVVAVGAGIVPALAQQTAPSSLQETYSDWQVVCQQVEGARACSMIQQQFQAQSNQRFLAVELKTADAGVEGAIVLPFGLNLSAGVELAIDDKPIGEKLQFRTCLPAGCVVRLAFSDNELGALSGGQTLQVKTKADSEEDLVFTVSLNGFTAAQSRLTELAN